MRVLIVLIVMGIPLAGGLNYVRNEPLDNELKDRPYAGISDADLDSLLGAYDKELSRYNGVADDPLATSYNSPESYKAYDEKVAAFERFQKSNESWKRVRREAAGHETTLKALQHERSIRDRGLDQEWQRIMRRVTTL